MTFPQILEYLTHRSSHGPPDNPSASCFDENQMPSWPYCCKDLAADVGQNTFVRARARLEMPPGRSILHAGQVLSNIGLELEIEGHHIRLEGVELSVVAAAGLPDLSGPLTEPTHSPFPALAA
jgi:hypothetical protein